MKLSRPERWILVNQYRILEALYPNDAESHAKCREALECGYELHYDLMTTHIFSGEAAMSEDECQEVIDILYMFTVLKRRYEVLEDTSGINEWHIEFKGFDGNNETKQMAYARFLCTGSDRHFDELGGGDFNSHAPLLQAYRCMATQWRDSADRYSPTREEIIRIIIAGFPTSTQQSRQT